MSVLDAVVLISYLIGITLFGASFGVRQKTGTDYFLGSRELPWVAVMLSVVATETSTITFLSVPAIAYDGNIAFLQIGIGYIVGRVCIAVFFLPAYYRGAISTAYQFLDQRFGAGTRRLTSGLFMVTRLLADSVRLFLPAIPLSLITGWSIWVCILVIGVGTAIYTYLGGIQAVVWVDVIQMGLYLFGALAALFLLGYRLPVSDGCFGVFELARTDGNLNLFITSLDASEPYTIWSCVIGGAFLSMGSHGTDQLMVQRLLACNTQTDSQKAVIWSGVTVTVQFALFLLIGLGLLYFYRERSFDQKDAIFATFIVEEMPAGVSGLLIAGIFSTAMSSLSSSINSLSSAASYDFYAPLTERTGEEHLLTVGRVFTLFWTVLLVGGAILYIPFGREATAVSVSLGVASMVYGGLLGVFLLGVLRPASGQTTAIFSILTGVGGVAGIWIVNYTGWAVRDLSPVGEPSLLFLPHLVLLVIVMIFTGVLIRFLYPKRALQSTLTGVLLGGTGFISIWSCTVLEISWLWLVFAGTLISLYTGLLLSWLE